MVFQEETSSQLADLERRSVMRLLLNELQTRQVMSNDASSLLYSYFLRDERSVDFEDKTQTKEIQDLLVTVLSSLESQNYAVYILESILTQHLFHQSTVDLCSSVVLATFDIWKNNNNYNRHLHFLTSLTAATSSTLDFSSFFFDFLWENFSSNG